MSIRNILSRNKKTVNQSTAVTTINHERHTVVCDTAELKEVITKWTENEGWKFENFADFLDLIDIKTPVRLSELNKNEVSFKCITALNSEVSISLRFGDFIDFCSEIWVTEGQETKRYETNSNYEKGKTVPSVSLSTRIIKRNGKELNSSYCKYFCHRTLKLDDTHTLKIEIDEPDKYNDKSETIVLRNCSDIEEYLLSLDNSLVVSQVYDKLIKLLNFSDENISSSEKILISYIENADKEERVRSKILLTKGKMQEYAILENGETFHVFKDGSWKYLSGEGIKIFYLEEKKHHVFSITGTEEKITNASPAEIMSRVKEKISELWKFVK